MENKTVKRVSFTMCGNKYNGRIIKEPDDLETGLYTIKTDKPLETSQGYVNTVRLLKGHFTIIAYQQEHSFDDYVKDALKNQPKSIQLTDKLSLGNVNDVEFLEVNGYSQTVDFYNHLTDNPPKDEDYIQLDKAEVTRLIHFLAGWLIKHD